MLTIDPDGQWNVDMVAFTQYVQQARKEMKLIPALLSQIEAYNIHLQYLIKVLALRLPLGQRHRDTANGLLHSLHQTLFGEKQGAVETLRHLIRERFLGQANHIHIPEAWFYWPITAGGAGLYQVHILTSGYNEYLAKQTPPTIPESRLPDWQDQSIAWGSFYSALFYDLDVRQPDSNQVMETLVADFIQRGASLSAGTQTSLAIYWRWILYLYGPQMIQHLGTFRFPITELVPLQLIMKRYQQTDVDTPGDRDSNLSEVDDHPF
jgi:hypothetical protein